MSKIKKVDKNVTIKDTKKQFVWKQSIKIDGKVIKVESLVVDKEVFESAIKKAVTLDK
ncbi:MAG: hypothetical protein HC932_05400 [Thermales bacterium]|nr:hypothetical protein [Thermales bacterium]